MGVILPGASSGGGYGAVGYGPRAPRRASSGRGGIIDTRHREGRSTYGPDSGDSGVMSTHSVAEATSQLPRLIDRALNGESVVIARDGQPVVELRPISAAPRPLTQKDIDWIDANRVGKAPAGFDAATEVRRMRDEGA